MIDLTKIKVGDEVTVRAKVTEFCPTSERPLTVKIQTVSEEICPLAAAIATHTPAPREFKPGDRVIAYDKAIDERVNCIVLAVDGDAVWVKTHGVAERYSRWTTIAGDLRHADESEPSHD